MKAATLGALSLLWLAVTTAWAPPASAGAERLADAVSPYLREHADNPVDWHPWGEAALARAAAENKPIFLSVGYATCYWCHVMEENVFLDPETARILNENFVPILVDREERPDLDRIYMPVRLLTGGDTGWPLSVFLTPDRKPFLAAGYIPNEQFREVLDGLGRGWRDDEARYRAHAARIAGLLAREHELVVSRTSGPVAGGRPAIEVAAERLARDFDPEYGGFEKAPRFPRPAVLEMLLALHERGGAGAGSMATTTLDALARGAIHDQLGGGFHRYAEDRAWRVPHFEKMLYDNAMLLRVYARAHTLFPARDYDRIAGRISDYVRREMTTDGGLFASAQDAQTDGVEGAYYLWRTAELESLLSAAERAALGQRFALAGPGAFEGAHALALAGDVSPPLAAARAKLLAARNRRPAPFRDDKAIAGWNGLMIEALAVSARLLHRDDDLRLAVRAATAALTAFGIDGDGNLARVAGAGGGGHLEDYAAMSLALGELTRSTGNARWLAAAGRLGDVLVRDFVDSESGAFFDVTARDAGGLIVRPRNTHDGDLPTGNSLAARALDSLTALGLKRFEEPALKLFAAYRPTLAARPDSLPYMLWALEVRRQRLLQAERDGPSGATSEVVRLSARIEPGSSDGSPMLVARLDIAPEWHVNANPAAFDFLIPTTFSANGGRPPETYPEARVLETPAGPFTVYKGTATVRFPLKGVAAGSKSLTVTVETQACGASGVCLLPSTLRATVFPR